MENQQELEKRTSPDVIVDFIRHGQASYTLEELQSGDIQGTLTEKGVEQIEDAVINNLAKDIDPDKELVILWVSPRGRAKQSAQVIENSLAAVGIFPIRQSVRKSLSDVQLFGYSNKIDEIFQNSEGKYWMDVWKNLEEVPDEIESPEDVKKRTNKVITYINRFANTIVPEGGKKPHFIILGHEETTENLLEQTFENLDMTGQGNGEILRMNLYKGYKDQTGNYHNPQLEFSFRGQNKDMEFDPEKREVKPKAV